jgi:predicted MPP superfamily phosphohydrolase
MTTPASGIAGAAPYLVATGGPSRTPHPGEGDMPDRPPLSRRQLLAAAAVAVPPLVTGLGVAYGRHALYDLRVNRLDVRVPNLPPDLDGLTIAHLTDVHVGKFVDDRYLRRVRDAANALRADLHLLTGDLIDLSIRDLPGALDFVTGLDPKHGLVMCEGNHDLIDSPAAFYAGVQAKRIPVPVDEALTMNIPGRPTPLRVLGLRWRGAGAAEGERGYDASVAKLKSDMAPGEFPILLAHHPHAFDAAAGAGIPLTLAGHTHGGLLMLSERVGPASLMYRYYRGLYRKGDASLYVSNGVGSWFPVRVNAHPEIAHLTLRRA